MFIDIYCSSCKNEMGISEIEIPEHYKPVCEYCRMDFDNVYSWVFGTGFGFSRRPSYWSSEKYDGAVRHGTTLSISIRNWMYSLNSRFWDGPRTLKVITDWLKRSEDVESS